MTSNLNEIFLDSLYSSGICSYVFLSKHTNDFRSFSSFVVFLAIILDPFHLYLTVSSKSRLRCFGCCSTFSSEHVWHRWLPDTSWSQLPVRRMFGQIQVNIFWLPLVGFGLLFLSYCLLVVIRVAGSCVVSFLLQVPDFFLSLTVTFVFNIFPPVFRGCFYPFFAKILCFGIAIVPFDSLLVCSLRSRRMIFSPLALSISIVP